MTLEVNDRTLPIRVASNVGTPFLRSWFGAGPRRVASDGSISGGERHTSTRRGGTVRGQRIVPLEVVEVVLCNGGNVAR